MKTEHPISITEELFEQWHEEWKRIGGSWPLYAATQAARWGADQELEACCEWMPKACPWDAEQLRAARRPKSPTLKEQALERCNDFIDPEGIIRQALKALPDV